MAIIAGACGCRADLDRRSSVVFAYAVMKLCEKHILDLDLPLTRS
jgi:hypothetical protein